MKGFVSRPSAGPRNLALARPPHVRDLIQRDAAQPTIDSWLDEILAGPLGGPFKVVEAMAEIRRSRDQAGQATLTPPALAASASRLS